MSSFQTTNTSPFTVADNTTSVTATVRLTKPGETPIERSVTRTVVPQTENIESIWQFKKEYEEFASGVDQFGDPEAPENILDFGGRVFAYIEDETPSIFTENSRPGGWTHTDSNGDTFSEASRYFMFAKKGLQLRNVTLLGGKILPWVSLGDGRWVARNVNYDLGFKWIGGVAPGSGPLNARAIDSLLWLYDWKHPELLLSPKITPSQQAPETEIDILQKKHHYKWNENWLDLGVVSDGKWEINERTVISGEGFSEDIGTKSIRVFDETSKNTLTNLLQTEVEGRTAFFHTQPNVASYGAIESWNPETGILAFVWPTRSIEDKTNEYLKIGVCCTVQEFLDGSEPGQYHYDFSRGYNDVDVYYHPEHNDPQITAVMPVAAPDAFFNTNTTDASPLVLDNIRAGGFWDFFLRTATGDPQESENVIRNSIIQYNGNCGGGVWLNNTLTNFSRRGGSANTAIGNFIDLSVGNSLILTRASNKPTDPVPPCCRPPVRIENNFFSLLGTIHGQGLSMYGLGWVGDVIVRGNIFFDCERAQSMQNKRDEEVNDMEDSDYPPEGSFFRCEDNLYIFSSEFNISSAQSQFAFNGANNTMHHPVMYKSIIRHNSFLGNETIPFRVDIGKAGYLTNINRNSFDDGFGNNPITGSNGSFSALSNNKVQRWEEYHVNEITRDASGQVFLDFESVWQRDLFLHLRLEWVKITVTNENDSTTVTTGEMNAASLRSGIVSDTRVRLPEEAANVLNIGDGVPISIRFERRGLHNAGGLAWCESEFYNNIVSTYFAVDAGFLFEQDETNGDFLLDAPLRNNRGLLPPSGNYSSGNYIFAPNNIASFSNEDVVGPGLESDGFDPKINRATNTLDDDCPAKGIATDGGDPGIRWSRVPTYNEVLEILNTRNRTWYQTYTPAHLAGIELDSPDTTLNRDNRVFWGTNSGRYTYRETT